MGDLKTAYKIEITKTGDGASAAVADFQKVDAAARAANVGMAAANTGSAALQSTTKGTAAALKLMAPTLTLIGMQALPQIATTAMTAQAAISGLGSAATAMNVSLAAAAGPLAVIAAGFLATAKAAKEMFAMNEATQQWSDSMQTMQERARIDAAKLREIIVKEVEKGRLEISDAQAAMFDKILDDPTLERLAVLRKQLTGMLPASYFKSDAQNSAAAREQITDLERILELEKSRAALNSKGPTLSAELEILNRRVALYHELYDTGVITEKELNALADEAATKWGNATAAIANTKQQLTDLQSLGNSVKMAFASGLSQAIVETFQGGDKALQKFAASFFATVAQMILQWEILQGMKALGFGLAASGGTFMAASGGMFPGMMASGGVQGVHEVSQATLFPKFNVVAGEAGREMLTVLAKPRFMEVGGMQAVVGKAGNNTLAITNADDLAANAGGAGSAYGRLVIEVRNSPDAEARIVSNSIKGAVVTVTNDMARDSKLSRTTKQLR